MGVGQHARLSQEITAQIIMTSQHGDTRSIRDTAHLGMSSSSNVGDSRMFFDEAYPEGVFVSRSIASKMVHPRSLQMGSPVVLHMR